MCGLLSPKVENNIVGLQEMEGGRPPPSERNVSCNLKGMFIQEMSDDECRRVLANATMGRLACARDNQPYVVPIYFAFDDTYLYGFTTVGQKVEWMRSNPLVCFEMDEVVSDNQWVSIVAFGRYEELPDTPAYESVRIRAHGLLQRRPVWWEPAYISQEHRAHPHSLTPVFYRIRLDKITGHRATTEEPRQSERLRGSG